MSAPSEQQTDGPPGEGGTGKSIPAGPWTKIDIAKVDPVYCNETLHRQYIYVKPESKVPSDNPTDKTILNSLKGTREAVYLTILMCAAEVTIKVVYAKVQTLGNGFDPVKLNDLWQNGKNAKTIVDNHYMALQKAYTFSNWNGLLNKHQKDPTSRLPDVKHCKTALGDKQPKFEDLPSAKEDLLMLIIVLASNAGLKENALVENPRKICQIDKDVLFGDNDKREVSPDLAEALWECPPYYLLLRVKYINVENVHHTLMKKIESTEITTGSITTRQPSIKISKDLRDTFLREMQNWGTGDTTSELFEGVEPHAKHNIGEKFGFYNVKGLKQKLTDAYEWMKGLPEGYKTLVRFSSQEGTTAGSKINLVFHWQIGPDNVQNGFGKGKYDAPKHRYELNLHLETKAVESNLPTAVSPTSDMGKLTEGLKNVEDSAGIIVPPNESEQNTPRVVGCHLRTHH
eukprot:TRINITY_DN4732_c0_g2_i1.p1 TRINITY_DN4732_c0_g2~~TRINITY_DN4732_c0_g2_i1.p1  ORF type:complete len:470 (+),score=57.34 TRINITY_DN4732_c0_g2_i1:40-1410(+)